MARTPAARARFFQRAVKRFMLGESLEDALERRTNLQGRLGTVLMSWRAGHEPR